MNLSPHREHMGESLLLDRLLPQTLDVLPERAPALAFLLGEAAEGLLVADAGEVGVRLPVDHSLLDLSLHFRVAPGQEAGPDFQVVPEPLEGLPPPGGALSFNKPVRPAVVPAAGAGRVARRVVAVPDVAAGGQPG